MALTSNQLKIKHLYSRAGFGISYNDLEAKKHHSISKAVDDLFSESKKWEPLELDQEYVPKSSIKAMAQLTPDEKKQLIKDTRSLTKDMNLIWYDKMSTERGQLREKMTLFWHGHFACRGFFPGPLKQLNNIHREYAFGNFKDMLLAVSRSPAMLQFLNNQQNKKGHPNENFARELMELFTLGRGNYTEQDIKESARAFTGWGYNRDGEYINRPFVHDDGVKTFFGKTGNFDGNDIINIILERPEAAQFITRKLYVFFVNDTPDENRVKELADYFYQRKYNIGDLLHMMFTSDWFYNSANMGNKIKSPAELIVGLNRQFSIDYKIPEVQLKFQSALGQTLFYPPNVAGWPGGKNWIDSSSLMLRLKIPSLILNDGEIEFSGKADPEDEAAIALKKGIQKQTTSRKLQTFANWDKFLAQFPASADPSLMAEFLLQPKPVSQIMNTLKQSGGLKNAAIEAVSTPEYQLC
ncbi:DUF1800 family protein [Pedobacter sp. HMF7647]|uniref:DUF1800 family protein n=1 Tax=Hufsiella arboris TaxID=2695275 RepID=A0A7K1Y4V7_9SPHI|nr:DUF1800 domain-containing protein [Hufsiella arboris]MXV49615.1 DUF1800 family protein [Hufsiella arboris]